MTRSRTELTACAGLAAGVVSLVLILLAATPWLSISGVLLLACIPTGAAVMCWIDSGEGAAQAGLILVVSLAIVALASTIMIWLTAWQPRVLLVLVAASLLSCGARLRRPSR